MKREDLLKEMKDSIGTKDPLEFFAKMVDVFTLLFDKIDSLEQDNQKLKTWTVLAIQWEPRVAIDMIAKEVKVLRDDKDTYAVEIQALKQAYADNIVTQKYEDFCKFWVDTLGWHPFFSYDI